MKNFENDKHNLNYEQIDTLHKEFLDIYNSADLNSVDDMRQKLAELLEHSKRHFNDEEILMEQFGYRAKREHIDEHKRILQEMEYFIKISCNRFGANMLKGYYKEKLPSWFDLHLMSMDSDLAYHLKKECA